MTLTLPIEKIDHGQWTMDDKCNCTSGEINEWGCFNGQSSVVNGLFTAINLPIIF